MNRQAESTTLQSTGRSALPLVKDWDSLHLETPAHNHHLPKQVLPGPAYVTQLQEIASIQSHY